MIISNPIIFEEDELNSINKDDQAIFQRALRKASTGRVNLFAAFSTRKRLNCFPKTAFWRNMFIKSLYIYIVLFLPPFLLNKSFNKEWLVNEIKLFESFPHISFCSFNYHVFLQENKTPNTNESCICNETF